MLCSTMCVVLCSVQGTLHVFTPEAGLVHGCVDAVKLVSHAFASANAGAIFGLAASRASGT